ncbi:hypothetical protein [Nitrosovibrio sp. Nv6]|uniref:hypothetical protein n=1 Tax=Nitrosovibrio sp. Nv6 TaxID=1855340 RepID=UPI0008CFB598|nr:hypothetical protein [Nitrosovibrio sp. Nv6]SEO84222.1 hypothetical protein SAMN05216316_1240 [Nitrosovibrio sp. Nv6]
MSKINQIQTALRELDGGAFQKLADFYLKKRGYDHLVPLGSVIGKNKVKTGTPDTLAIFPNGRYVFAEYTTQQTGLFAKLKDDLDKCFDEEKTGIPVARIQEIVFCHTSTLSTTEFNDLREICETHGVNLNISDIGSISYDLLENYRGLARDYLGIEVDTGQIISTEEFVAFYGKNKVATRLDTAFHFREDELQKIGTALDNHDLVVVLGRAGVGKTRLALECCTRFGELHPEYKTLCIYNRGPDIFEDLRIHFGERGAFLILVDDANRMSNFEYFIQLLQEQRRDRRIKVIATVRDYAAEKIRDASRTYGEMQEINILPLTEEQIKELVEKEYGICNNLYLDRIANIAKGNPRLAIMVAEVAKEKDTLDSINDVSGLYDSYFASIRRDLGEFGNVNLLKVAGIVAFFRVIDRTNEKIMDAVEEAFGISPEIMWESINRLHNMEMVDIYEDEAAKVSDQVLATYLFYLAFFKELVLEFGKLLDAFFPKHRQRLIDALNPVMQAFDRKALLETIRPHVDRFWEKQIRAENEIYLLQLIDVFWFLKQTDALVYVQDQITAMPIVRVDLASLDFEAKSEISNPSILGILRSFQHTSNKTFRVALNLLCDYLERCPTALPQILSLFIEQFSFRRTSYMYGYDVQHAVVDVIWERAQQGADHLFSKVFMAVTKKYLRTKFNYSENKGNNAINIINFEVLSSIELTKLRKSMWEGLLHLYKVKNFEDEVLKVLHHYSVSRYDTSNREVVAYDAVEVVPFLERELSPLKFKHCLLVQTYLEKLGQCNVRFDNMLKKKFASETYYLYKLLATDISEMHTLGLTYDEYKAHKNSKIGKHIFHYNLEDYKQFVAQCAEVNASMAESHQEYQFKVSVVLALTILAGKNPKLYSEVLKYYLEQNDPFRLNCYPLVKNLIEVCGAQKAYSILNEAVYPTQRAWLCSFYCFLPQAEISKKRLNQLLNLYQISEWDELPVDWDYLLSYRTIEPRIISKITELLLVKAENDASYARSLFNLFNPLTKVNEEIVDHFSGKTDLLKRAYFLEANTTEHGDHDGRNFNRLLDLDSNFIVEYIDYLYGKKKWISKHDDYRDYSFIWDRDDYQEIMIGAAERIFKYEKEASYYSYFEVFFGLQRSDQESQNLNPRQVSLLMALIESKPNDVEFMRFVFSLVSNFSVANRAQFVSKFVELNGSFDDFEQLPLEPDCASWSGSAVPMLHGRVEYLKTLIPLFDTVSLLKHKQYVEHIIKNVRKQIEQEKKDDFMDD